MNPITAIYNALSADSTLTGILSGGLYNWLDTPELSRQATPAAFDEFGEMKPSGLLKPESATPWGPLPDGGRVYIVLWLYDQAGFEALDAARERLYTLLHRQQITTEAGIFDIRHSNDILGGEVPGLDVSMCVCRYYATIYRKVN
jgi:hypothetical protein